MNIAGVPIENRAWFLGRDAASCYCRTTLQQEHVLLQQQHSDLQVQYQTVKEYQSASQHSHEIIKFQLFLKRMTPNQVLQLQELTDFHVDTYEDHASTHLSTTQQFVDIAITHLMASLHQVLLHQTSSLKKRENARRNVEETLKAAEVPEEVRKEAVGVLEKEIGEIQNSVAGWNALLAALEQDSGGEMKKQEESTSKPSQPHTKGTDDGIVIKTKNITYV